MTRPLVNVFEYELVQFGNTSDPVSGQMLHSLMFFLIIKKKLHYSCRPCGNLNPISSTPLKPVSKRKLLTVCVLCHLEYIVEDLKSMKNTAGFFQISTGRSADVRLPK